MGNSGNNWLTNCLPKGIKMQNQAQVRASELLQNATALFNEQ